MNENKTTKTKRASLMAAGGLMMVSALLFWIADIGTVYALCLAASGLCFLGAALNVRSEAGK